MAQPAAVEQHLPDNRALLPVAAVFLLPKRSALSPLALDIVAQTARRTDLRQSLLSGPTMTEKLARQLRQRFCGAMQFAMN